MLNGFSRRKHSSRHAFVLVYSFKVCSFRKGETCNGNDFDVDDSASMRQMVSYTLKSAGFDVIQTCDGIEALQWAEENVCDLVLSDVNMPNLDGIGLVKQLRELPEYRFIPILMLTTEASYEKKMEGKNAGATGWIVKPFEPQQLISNRKKSISDTSRCILG